MSCTACQQKNLPCGCEESTLTTMIIPECDPTKDCPAPEPCDELTDSNCVVYSGADIPFVGIKKGDRMQGIIQTLILLATNPSCIINNGINTCFSPANIYPSTVTKNSILINWALAANAVSYVVEYKVTTLSTWNTLPPQGPTIQSQVIAGLAPNTKYDIRVRANCSSGSCYSVSIQVTTPLT